MKRRQFISTAPPLPILVLGVCEKNIPYSPTIMTGKVTDENNLLVGSVEFLFYGTNKKGFYQEYQRLICQYNQTKKGCVTFHK